MTKTELWVLCRRRAQVSRTKSGRTKGFKLAHRRVYPKSFIDPTRRRFILSERTAHAIGGNVIFEIQRIMIRPIVFD